MTAAASVNPELRDLYARESAAIQLEFSETGDGRRALDRRSALVDSIVQTFWDEIIVPSAPKQPPATSGTPSLNQHHDSDSLNPTRAPKNFALVATGGYGRGWLFPHSDIDLLFLHAGSDTENEFKDPIRRFSQELWDLRLKLSPATRTLAECERLDPNNLEFAISLLDCRYLAGDRDLFFAPPRKIRSPTGSPRMPRTHPESGRTHTLPPSQIRQHGLSSRAERERRSRRLARL